MSYSRKTFSGTDSTRPPPASILTGVGGGRSARLGWDARGRRVAAGRRRGRLPLPAPPRGTAGRGVSVLAVELRRRRFTLEGLQRMGEAGRRERSGPRSGLAGLSFASGLPRRRRKGRDPGAPGLPGRPARHVGRSVVAV